MIASMGSRKGGFVVNKEMLYAWLNTFSEPIIRGDADSTPPIPPRLSTSIQAAYYIRSYVHDCNICILSFLLILEVSQVSMNRVRKINNILRL